jgi:hypothetical protein
LIGPIQFNSILWSFWIIWKSWQSLREDIFDFMARWLVLEISRCCDFTSVPAGMQAYMHACKHFDSDFGDWEEHFR